MFRDRAAEKFLSDLERSEETQAAYLSKLVAANVGSDFGRRHNFDAVRTVEDFRTSVPIGDYEAIRPDVARILEGEQGVLTTQPVKRFFMTSGSASAPKHVPVTQSLIRDKSRAFGIYWSLVFRDHPNGGAGRIVTNFSDSGRPTETGAGLPAGSESSFWAEATRATQRQAPLIPKDVARIRDPADRYRRIAAALEGQSFAAVMALNPSTLLLLFEQLDRPAKEVWPDLELAISWRSPMLAPYLSLLAPHLEGIAVRDYITMASEGVIAIPTQDTESGGALAVGVHFYELLPLDRYESKQTVLPHEAEVGGEYVVVMTTPGGLYRYDIGDVVRVKRFIGTTPVVEFLHRAGRTCSLTGEKLTEAQVTAAMAEAVAELEIESFTLTPSSQGLPHYTLYVEVRQGEIRDLAQRLDVALGRHNGEWASKRGSLRLGAVEVAVVRAGTYAAERQRRVAAGATDDQVKQTHLSREAPDFLERAREG